MRTFVARRTGATDTAISMRVLRTLAAAGLAVSLLTVPAPSVAQSPDEPSTSPLPQARQPDGRWPLEGTPWRLESYRHRGRSAMAGPEVAAFLELGAGTFDGSGGCSRVRGRYGVSGTVLSLKLQPASKRDCAENVAIVQQAVENGLRKAGSYALEAGAAPDGDKLVIYSVTGEELLRYGLDDLAVLDGVQWRLESYTTGGETMPALTETPALLSFRPQSASVHRRRQSGPISGTSGCNAIVAEYYRSANVLSFGQLGLTDAPCTAELAAQEAAVTAVLEATAVRLDLPADRLTLTSTDTGERLEFVSQVPLEGTTWWLEGSIGGARPAERITLRLEDGQATGEGPCGAYRGSYATDGVFITFSDVVGAGEEECEGARVERAIIGALRRTAVVDRTSEGLTFRTARGNRTLTFGRPFAP